MRSIAHETSLRYADRSRFWCLRRIHLDSDRRVASRPLGVSRARLDATLAGRLLTCPGLKSTDAADGPRTRAILRVREITIVRASLERPWGVPGICRARPLSRSTGLGGAVLRPVLLPVRVTRDRLSYLVSTQPTAPTTESITVTAS